MKDVVRSFYNVTFGTKKLDKEVIGKVSFSTQGSIQFCHFQHKGISSAWRISINATHFTSEGPHVHMSAFPNCQHFVMGLVEWAITMHGMYESPVVLGMFIL
jgi:hypothetical protein